MSALLIGVEPVGGHRYAGAIGRNQPDPVLQNRIAIESAASVVQSHSSRCAVRDEVFGQQQVLLVFHIDTEFIAIDLAKRDLIALSTGDEHAYSALLDGAFRNQAI